MPDWKTESEGSYHILDARCATWPELAGLLAHWWQRLADLSQAAEESWDCLVCDLWPEGGGRLIGHAQRQTDAVGLDVGFRICATLDLRALVGRSEFDAQSLVGLIDNLEEILMRAAALPPAREALAGNFSGTPVYLTAYGEGPLTSARRLRLELSQE